ncbi:hypothetical protein [Streptomyces sp. CB03238]|uniref:hypothetical protein n=1 Tax=Streptomyces sp. CB03238 TaxID=1907777 RepID=UPI000A1211B7|nr:hypothetical protein [Streptomyces sp. CB03238]ORT54223.1 hypothetical protein BKD26_36140 [Streptomyces sp. CB03238]
MDKLGKQPVTAKVSLLTRERLTEEIAAQKERRVVLAGDERWSVAGLSRREAAQVRAAWRRELARLRQAGELLDTIDVLAIHGIELELRARGWWDRRWPAVPDEAMDPGRWPGSRDGGYPKGVPLRLPQPLARKVYAACWHTSAKSIAALRDWRDQNPGIVPPRWLVTEDWTTRELAGPLREYVELAWQVTTVGDVWRGGLWRGIEAGAALRSQVAN